MTAVEWLGAFGRCLDASPGVQALGNEKRGQTGGSNLASQETKQRVDHDDSDSRAYVLP